MKKLITVVLFSACSFAAHAQAASTDWLISPAEALSYQGEGGFNEHPRCVPALLCRKLTFSNPSRWLT